jgi:uroporphyrinogen decarboxylase
LSVLASTLSSEKHEERMTMTRREIIKANMEYRCEGRIGFNFSDGGRLDDITGAGIQHGFQPRRWETERFEHWIDLWGNEWHRIKGLSQGGEVYRPVIAEWSELDRLVLPDLLNPAFYEDARRLGQTDQTAFRVGWMPGWPFAICRYMRKMETYFVDLLTEREQIDVLHDRVTTLLEGVITRYGEAGLDAVMYCEDLGIQDRLLMSPALWRDVFRPLYERLTSRAHACGLKVIQHSCGYNWELIDDLCGSGVDCLQFDQPAVYDMPALAVKLRKHGVGLFAPCDIQQVLPTGNRALIERETKRLVDTFRGGLIAKNYPDLHGIGVEPEWDQWAYDVFVREGGGAS